MKFQGSPQIQTVHGKQPLVEPWRPTVLEDHSVCPSRLCRAAGELCEHVAMGVGGKKRDDLWAGESFSLLVTSFSLEYQELGEHYE